MAEKTWEILEGACYSCRKCKLWETRNNVVIGKGNKNADIMFIGEGPGQQEDLTGIPFVGPAGQLLDKMLKAIDLTIEEEQEACLNYLRYQLVLVKPKIIVCLGRIAGTAIISPTFRITKQRGQWIERKGYWITSTFHPSALLRDESKKRPAWEDFKSIKQKLMELGQNEV